MSYLKQDNKPLYQDLIWMEPKINFNNFKVLIMGGNLSSLKNTITVFNRCQKRKLIHTIVLPNAVKKIIGNNKSQKIIFTPSTQSGSFALSGLAEILLIAKDHNCLLLTGNFSSNNETLQLVEKLLMEFKNQKIMTGRIIKPILELNLNEYENLTLILADNQFEILLKKHQLKKDYNPNLSLDLFANLLIKIKVQFNFITYHNQHLWLKSNDNISVTKLNKNEFNIEDMLYIMTEASYYLSISPTKIFQSLTTAIWQLKNSNEA